MKESLAKAIRRRPDRVTDEIIKTPDGKDMRRVTILPDSKLKPL